MWNRRFIFLKVQIAVCTEKSVIKVCTCSLFSSFRAVLKGFSVFAAAETCWHLFVVFVQNILGTRLHVFVEAVELRGKN
jgi:hypothetical protein